MWSRVDDEIPSHPKFLKAGPTASWLWICGLCYCNKHLTDGFIPAAALPIIGSVPAIQAHAKQLVAVGLWEIADGGYQVHHFHDHNDTRAEAIARQDVRSEQRRKAGIASGASRRQRGTAPLNETRTAPFNNTVNEQRTGPFKHGANEKATGGVEPHPIPSHPIPTDPIQIPSDPADLEEKQSLALSDHASADADFERFRQAYPISRRVGGKTAKSAWKAATQGRNGTHFAAMLAALEQHKRSEQWQTPKLIPLMTTWLNQERWNQTLPETVRVSSAGQSTASAAQRVKDSLRRTP